MSSKIIQNDGYLWISHEFQSYGYCMGRTTCSLDLWMVIPQKNMGIDRGSNISPYLCIYRLIEIANKTAWKSIIWTKASQCALLKLWHGMECPAKAPKPTQHQQHFLRRFPSCSPRNSPKRWQKQHVSTSFNPSNLRPRSFPRSTGRRCGIVSVGDSSCHHEILEKSGWHLSGRPSANSQHSDIETICGPLNSSLTSAAGSSCSWFAGAILNPAQTSKIEAPWFKFLWSLNMVMQLGTSSTVKPKIASMPNNSKHPSKVLHQLHSYLTWCIAKSINADLW